MAAAALIYLIYFTPSGRESVISSNRLSCSKSDYNKYREVMLEIGDFGFGLDVTQGTETQRQELLNAYDKVIHSGSGTVIVAGFLPEAEIFLYTCESEKCALREASIARNKCLMKTYNDCVDLAVRFRGTDYCLIAPDEVQ